MISLFDKQTQYIIAEATPICNLRGDNNREQANSLWIGVGRFPSPKSTMCYRAMKSFVEDHVDFFVVNDLTEDTRFRDHWSVADCPHNKFYVSAPIRSPDNYVIGTVAVLDDKPRDGISAEQGDFLAQLAATVMDYLSSQRAMREEYREEKMVRALGLFVKGKSDSSEFDRNKAPDTSQQNQVNDINKRLEQLSIPSSGEHREKNRKTQDQEPSTDGKHKGESPIHKFAEAEKESQGASPNLEDGPEAQERKRRPALSPTTSQLKESLAPSHVQSVVNRAAAMIYQALDLEGVMFVDASVYTRRQAVGSNKRDYKRDVYNAESPDRKSSSEENVPLATNPDSGASDDNGESRSLVLGHYTSSTSKGGVNLKDNHYVSLAGSFVSHLIDQYPHGKIFHIEPDGSISLSYEGASDELNYSDRGCQEIPVSKTDEINVKQETMDIKQLMEVLPEARCIAIYPIYDFQRGRYFTVNLVWTNDPGRVLSEPKDLTYLAAFSNTVMAEVSRLDLEATVRAKGDFISSISHELRSPLHGLLGSVELLQDIVTGYAQRSLVETVYSCGRTLLDTLNHLLDYAKINTLTRQATSEISSQKGLSELQPATSGLKQDENLDVLVQEVVEGILAGIEYQRREAKGGSFEPKETSDQVSDTSRQLMTIVDIEWLESWRHSIYAGAWRRVVMNLFGNALKYTQSGYIRLLMQEEKMKVDGKKTIPAIRMTFSDSGRGMSKDFILNHLYTAFHQEDATAPGLGVGLHLVHQIVRSLNGTIEISSEPGKGTNVDIVLPIDPPEHSEPSEAKNTDSLRKELEGKTIALFTRSSNFGNTGIDQELFDNMLTSLGRMATSWFGLRIVNPDEHSGHENVDFAIVTEHEYRTYYDERSRDPKEEDSGEFRPLYPLIVLSERISNWKATNETVEDSVIFLTQP